MTHGLGVQKAHKLVRAGVCCYPSGGMIQPHPAVCVRGTSHAGDHGLLLCSGESVSGDCKALHPPKQLHYGVWSAMDDEHLPGETRV